SHFINPNELNNLSTFVEQSHNALHEQPGPGHEFLGWLNLPHTYDQDEFLRIKQVAQQIKEDTDVLLVIGIGGSYLGALAAINMLTHSFHNLLPTEKRPTPAIIFVGHHLSSTYINDLFDLLDDKDVSINVISKSGTTT